METGSSRSSLIIAAAIVIAGVLISASLLFAMDEMRSTTPVTTTSVTTTTETLTSEYTVTLNSTLLAECSRAGNPGDAWFGDVAASSRSPAVICVQFYYFNQTAPLVMNVTRALSIVDYPICSKSGACTEPSAAVNFTIGVSQDLLVLGGPGNENEGTVAAWSLTAKPGVVGTYQLSLNGPSPYALQPGEPVECNYYGQVYSGSGQPDKEVTAMCITYTYSTSGTTSQSSNAGTAIIPGIQYPILNGDLYFRVVGVVNSTA